MPADPIVWKHIGMHGHTVGTFACYDDKMQWKSSIAAVENEGLTATTRTIPASQIAAVLWTVFGRGAHIRIQTKQQQQQAAAGSGKSHLPHEIRLDGFPSNDFEVLKDALQQKYNITLKIHNMSAAGTQYGITSVKGKNLVFQHCVLDEMNEEGQEFEPRAEEEMMSIHLNEVSQCVLPGNNRNEIEVQFPESDAVEADSDQLVAIRFYIPPDLEADPADKEAPTAAELLQAKITATANIRKTAGDVIVSFDQAKGTFLTPRGRYGIELYDYFLRMRGQKYDYKIKYDDISRLFLLPKPDEVHMAFVIALDKPIRQGQQRYQYLVLQATKDPDEVTVHMDAETLQKEYAGELQPVMRGSLSNLIAKTFKVIARKKVFIPGKFANANEQACVKCAVRANEGLLYPLEKQFVFIHKPPILIRFNEVESVEFQRYAGGQGSTRNFDLCVNLKSAVVGSAKEYVFSGIDRSDYAGLYNFISAKKIPIKNIQGLEEAVSTTASRAPVYNEDEIFGAGADEMMEEESEDDDYDENAAAEDDEGSSVDSADDEDLGSEVDDELDSDLEEARKTEKKKTKKRKKEANDSDDDDEDDEEASSPKKKKVAKKKKDPNAPKRGMSAFMFFSNANREKEKQKDPDLSFGELGKLLGKKWKAMSAEDKKEYEDMATADKARYEKEMASYTPLAASSAAKASKKKKKDPNAPKRGMTSFFFFSSKMRPKIKAENPDMSFGELGKKLGEMFRELKAEEKEKYEQLAKKDKERYKKEIAAYKASAKDEGGNHDGEDNDDDDSDGVHDAANDHDDDDDSDDDSDDE